MKGKRSGGEGQKGGGMTLRKVSEKRREGSWGRGKGKRRGRGKGEGERKGEG